MAGQSFGTTNTGGARFNVVRLGPILEAIHERLAGVIIECLPWQEFVDRYDGAETLFYLDPPYYGSEEDYGSGRFSPGEFRRLAARLGGISGRFVLSINDRAETREMFGRFAIEPVSTRYTIAGGKWAEAKEILVFGPSPEVAEFARRRDLFSDHSAPPRRR